MSMATVAVRFAAWTLPRKMRNRYREQWLADLRDAEEAGIPPADIVFGSLAFAATLNRPLFSDSRALDAEAVTRRSRVAAGLALSAALVALTQYANIFVGFDNVASMYAREPGTEILAGWLGAYSWIAPVAAGLIVMVTRGTRTGVSIAVIALVFASFVGEIQPAIDRASQHRTTMWHAEPWIYPTALGLVAAASVFLWFALGRPRQRTDSVHGNRRLLASSIGGMVVLAAALLVIAHTQTIWETRLPLPFGPSVSENLSMWLQWMELKLDFEQLMVGTFSVLLVAGAVLACLVIAVGLPRRGTVSGVTAAAVFALCFLTLGYAALLSFLEAIWGVDFASRPIVVLFLVGRIGLVAVILYAVGGLRLPRSLPRMRRRPDMRSDAELIGG